MKLPGFISQKRPLNRKEALLCLLVNISATPGLGTFWARRWAGIPQLMLSVSGFCIFMGVFGWYVVKSTELLEPASFAGSPTLWLHRAMWLFGAAWVWSALSGLLILKQTLPLTEKTPPPMPR
jgi:TRAP-type C4-dicarboxylate transport system permease small subunit